MFELYPGDSGARQPVHTVYGGAHLFTAETAKKLGELALRSMDTYAPDAATFAEAIGLSGSLGPKGAAGARLPDASCHVVPRAMDPIDRLVSGLSAPSLRPPRGAVERPPRP